MAYFIKSDDGKSIYEVSYEVFADNFSNGYAVFIVDLEDKNFTPGPIPAGWRDIGYTTEGFYGNLHT